MTDTKRLNGKSVAQLKKDAKRLSKLQSQPLSISLDFVARSLGYPTWAIAMSRLDTKIDAGSIDGLNYRIPGDSNLTLSLSTNSPAGFIIGPTASGKTLLLRHMCHEYLQAGKDIVVVSFSSAGNLKQTESSIYGRLFTYDVNGQDKKINLEEIMSLHPGSIVIADELWAFRNLIIPSDAKDLKSICNKHDCFFVGSSQSLTDIPSLSPGVPLPTLGQNKGIDKHVPQVSFVLQYKSLEKSKPIHLLGVIEKGDFKSYFRLTTDKHSFHIQDDGGVGYSGILHLKQSQIESSKIILNL